MVIFKHLVHPVKITATGEHLFHAVVEKEKPGFWWLFSNSPYSQLKGHGSTLVRVIYPKRVVFF